MLHCRQALADGSVAKNVLALATGLFWLKPGGKHNYPLAEANGNENDYFNKAVIHNSR